MDNHQSDAHDVRERALVFRLVNNDEEAFSELYASYKDRLIYFAMRFVKSREFAEDIFHDVFLVIWQSRHFINPEYSFSSYVYTMVKNRVLNMLRGIESEKRVMQAILSQAIDYNDDTSRNVLYNELNEIIEKAINRLTPRQKEIFRMSREEHMSHREIAQKLNLSIYTVQEHITQALKSIRCFLAKYPGSMADLLLILICLNI
ncbi:MULTISPECIES: RNA polymerase sigma-70 factor [unclassified Proteiniphilum]|uniref:RNA polymerase sigma-70 factor n=2 Tax=Proteiniphilum TaxID=294702 RepID=UPI00257EA4F6|nr:MULTISPECIES: RNA polymerase sigma-70 factor [unclassified Proteiniphilum]